MADIDTHTTIFSEYVYDELKHIRLIHFTLSTITAAIAYVAFANWTPAVELHSDLNSFKSTINQLQPKSLQSDPAILKELNPDKFRSIILHIRDSISSTMHHHVAIHRNTYSILNDYFRLSVHDRSQIENSDRTPIWQLRKLVENGTWRIYRIGRFYGNIETARKELEAGFAKHTNPVILAYEVRELSYSSDTPIKHGTISFAMTVDSKGYSPDFPPLNVTEVNLSWTACEDSIRTSKRWFTTSHPYMSRYWDTISSMSIGAAMAWASVQESSMLQGHQFNVLGLSFRGTHIGYIGPAAIIILMLYLGLYVFHIHRQVKSYATAGGTDIVGIAPWIGAMNNPVAQIFTYATFCAAGIVGIGIPLWRFAGARPATAIALAFADVLFTFCLAIATANLAKMYKSIQDVRNFQWRTVINAILNFRNPSPSPLTSAHDDPAALDDEA